MMPFNKCSLNYLKMYRHVNTWSPLATAFNSITKSEYGFNLSKKETVSPILSNKKHKYVV